MSFYVLKKTNGRLPNMVDLTYTDAGLKAIPETEREKVWTDMLLHIHECKTKEESYEKAEKFLSQRFST